MNCLKFRKPNSQRFEPFGNDIVLVGAAGEKSGSIDKGHRLESHSGSELSFQGL